MKDPKKFRLRSVLDAANQDDASLKIETDYMDRQVKKTAERHVDRGAMEKMRAAKYEASKTEEILNDLKKRKKLKSKAY